MLRHLTLKNNSKIILFGLLNNYNNNCRTGGCQNFLQHSSTFKFLHNLF